MKYCIMTLDLSKKYLKSLLATTKDSVNFFQIQFKIPLFLFQ